MNQLDLNLKIGDIAYFVMDEFGKPEKVIITGDCDEGTGYTAYSQASAIKHNDTGMIHTCNGSLYRTKKEARIESLRILRKTREDHVERQTYYLKCIQYIDLVISRNGRYDG